MKNSIKILVADDDPVILAATRRVLESAGYETLSAQDGQEALELTRAQLPDMLLLDVNMPKMDGFEVCRQIKADPALAKTFVIILSSERIDSDSHVDGLNLGADGYIARPIANRVLLARVQTMLRIQAVERALQISDAQWSATFDAVADAIFLTDASCTILKCNRAAAEMWQLPAEALVGKKCYEVVHCAEAPASACPLALVRETKHREVLTFAQNERWLEAKVDPMFDANGNFTGTVHVITDITERKQAEEALTESEEKWHSLVKNSPDYIALHDQEGRYLFLNHYAEGFTEKDVIGSSLYQYLLPESVDIFRSHMEKALNTWTTQHFEHTALGDLGATRRYEEDLVPFHGKNQEINILAVSRDITERKQVEDTLRESEERYHSLFDRMMDGVYRSTHAGKFVDVNPAMVRMFGFSSKEEMLNVDIRNELYFAPDERGSHVLDTGREEMDVYRMRRKDGSEIWVEDHGFYVHDKQGRIIYHEGMLREITERKQAETLREVLLEIMLGVVTTKELWDFLSLVHRSIAKVIYAENFFVVLYNKDTTLFEEVYSVDKFDPPGPPSRDEKSISAYIFRTGRPLLLNNEQVFSELVAQGEVELVGTNSPSWMGVPLKTSKETIGVMVVQDYDTPNRYTERDVEVLTSIAGQVALAVERKRAEETLHESEKRFRALIENSSDAITLLDAKGIAVYDSPAAPGMLGYAPEDWIGRDVFSLIHPDDFPKARDLFQNLVETPAARVNTAFRVHHKNGSWLWIEMIATNLLFEPGVKAIVLNYRDISERKQAEEALKEYNTRLEAAVEARTRELREAQEQLVRQEKLAVLGQLAGGVGHELRNPLGIINNAIYFLRMVQPEADEKVREYLGIIETEAHNADKIISDLLDFSRIKSVDVEPVAVSDLVRRTLERFPAPENVLVTFKLPENLPTIYVDPRQVTQVLGNLVLNACQAMSKGGKLTLSAKKKGKMVAIIIADTGTGITPENMIKLFEPLFTTKPKGIGLGLAVSQKLVEANGGRIEVESEPGKGSTFMVYLPVHQMDEPT